MVSNERLRAEALGYCAQAAVTFCSSTSIDRKYRALSMAVASLHRFYGEDEGPIEWRPKALLELMTEPASEWIGADATPLLLEGDGWIEPTSYAETVADEAGTKPRLEAAQQAVKTVREGLWEEGREDAGQKGDAQQKYVAFRTSLIRQPVRRHTEAMRFTSRYEDPEKGVRYGDLFEDIRQGQTTGGEDTCFYPCPRCGYPMQIETRGTLVYAACGSRDCRQEGAQGRVDPETGSWASSGGRTHQEPVLADDPEGEKRVQLAQGIWRYTTLPGLLEVDLKERIDRVNGARAELWPELDRYDLHVKKDDHTWKVDVKNWTSVFQGAQHLPSRETSDVEAREVNWHDAPSPARETMHIVLPDHREPGVRRMNEWKERRSWKRGYRFWILSDFVSRIQDG